MERIVEIGNRHFVFEQRIKKTVVFLDSRVPTLS